MSYALHHGDCVDVMGTFPDACIDLTVTSPPYDNLRTYNGAADDWNEDKWRAVIAELYRVTKPGGVVVWVVGDATINGSETGTSFRQALYAMECGFRLHDTMIWKKSGTGAAGSKYAYWQAFEYMFVWTKGRPATVNRISTGKPISAGGQRIRPSGKVRNVFARAPDRLSLRDNVWTYTVGGASGDERTGHPAKFPEALARDHILSWSNEGDVVFDPFTGSGTTGKMALLHGRKFIGVEKQAEYLAIAEARIANAIPPLLQAAE
jgi:site-specific DNA-methyltransferase (adenine-specific)